MHKLVLAALIPLAACGNFGNNDDDPGIPGTGSGSSRSYAAADFTRVELAGSDDVDVRVGGGFSVRAEGDPDVLERLRIRRDGATLSIGRRSGGLPSWGSSKARITVTMPRIAAADLAGSGDLAVDRVEGERFAGEVAGSGTIRLGAVAVQELGLDIAGSGNLAAAGTAQRLKVSIAGSGSVDARRLTARAAEVSIAGSGDVTAAVDGEARVEIMGSGSADLGPKARCRVDKMGSGSARCGG